MQLTTYVWNRHQSNLEKTIKEEMSKLVEILNDYKGNDKKYMLFIHSMNNSMKNQINYQI